MLVPETWYARRGRRGFDLAVLSLLFVPTLPVMAAIALVNLVLFRDPHRVFFTQPRIGWRGRPFRIFKFRTMREARSCEVRSWSSGDDRLRVTRFGRLLRNTHLDELPQLFNVLIGDMGFIGPRPEMIEIEAWADAEIPGFTARLAIRPGITGLAQVTQGYTGRDLVAYLEKLELNEQYLRQQSLALDLELVVRTILWMLRGRGWGWKESAAAAARGDSGAGQRASHRRRRAG